MFAKKLDLQIKRESYGDSKFEKKYFQIFSEFTNKNSDNSANVQKFCNFFLLIMWSPPLLLIPL